MKKIIVLFTLATLFKGFLFAQDAGTAVSPEENKIALEYANYLFEDGFLRKGNAEKIAELTPFLTAEQREYLCEENEKSGVTPFLLNLLVGFGVGSFVQGDKAIGHVQLWGDIVGLGLLIPGIVLTLDAADELETSAPGLVMTAVGSLITLGVAIPAYIRPWTFAADRNRKVRRSLRVDANGKAVALSDKADTLSVSFAPLILPVTHEYGLMAKITF